MPDMIDLARIIASVQIDDVRLREASLRSFLEPANVAEELSVKSSHEATVTRDRGDDAKFLISVSLLLEIRAVTGADDLLAEIGAVFNLSYHLPADEVFSTEEIERFGQFNAVFNAWPYWREFVQTSLSRMDMPSLTVPLYRLPRRESAQEES